MLPTNILLIKFCLLEFSLGIIINCAEKPGGLEFISKCIWLENLELSGIMKYEKIEIKKQKKMNPKLKIIPKLFNDLPFINFISLLLPKYSSFEFF
jgi:hypothetical protein